MFDYIYTQQYRGNNPGWRPKDDVSMERIGDVIYAHTTLVPEIFANPPKEPFNLVTESGDLGINDNGDEIRIGNIYVSNWSVKKKDIPETLKTWFAQHANIIHPKIKALPLGIPHGNEKRMQEILQIVNNDGGKSGLAYLNCREDSNINERGTAYMVGFWKKGWTVHYHPKDLLKYNIRIDNLNEMNDRFLYEVARHKFTICPMGAGIDTYRFWESLYLGSIPVVRSCQNLTKNWNLPILEVENWSDCTEQFLNKQYEIILARGQNQEYNLDQLNRSYYTSLISTL